MTLSVLLHAGCAGLYFLLAVMVLFSTRPDRTSYALAASCLVSAVWAAGVASNDAGRTAGVLDLARPVAWYGFVLHLYFRSIPNGSRLGRLLSALGLLTIFIALADLAIGNDGPGALSIGINARLGLAVCTVLLIENLYRNAAEDLRWHIILPCVALGGLCVYDLVLYSDAALFQRVSPVLFDGRAVVMALLTPLLAIAALRSRRRWGVTIQVSHRAVFYSASLVVIGVFLLGLAATGEVLRQLGSGRGSDWGTVVEVSLVCGGLLAAAVFVTSGSARSSLRHLVINNFLSHRYDYRLEWLRCIGTLSQTGSAEALHTRAIKAVAQIVDSPAGMVFLREPEDGVFRWAGSWNLPSAGPILSEHPLVPLFRNGAWVVQAPDALPWVGSVEGPSELWLAVPLSHAGRLMGFTLVSRPRAPFVLDGEVFALLRIVGQEVASYIAERQAAEALLQTRQLREYGQRFAFVAHDIKNVSSQLSLLLANAERHISNPEFQRDMLGTVGASVQKITTLLARLKAPEEQAPTASAIAAADRLAALVGACSPARRDCIQLDASAVHIVMPPAAFDAVVTHLLDNAFEASAPGAPVRIRCHAVARRVLIDIIDQGAGMTPEFIREQLFRPFSSSKQDGFGIGVYQARELLRQSGGDLIVTSTPGIGTTMRLSLPLAPAPATGAVLQVAL